MVRHLHETRPKTGSGFSSVVTKPIVEDVLDYLIAAWRNTKEATKDDKSLLTCKNLLKISSSWELQKKKQSFIYFSF